jgi:hypothetical protein
MLKIRKADIDPQLRTRLERYGVPVTQQMLSHVRFRDEKDFANIETYQVPIMAWLTEEHDRAELKANVSLPMRGLLHGKRAGPQQSPSTVFLGSSLRPC